MFRRRLRPVIAPFHLALLVMVLVACVQGGGPNPGPTADLSIGAPRQGQTLAGTVIVMAGGVGGSAQDLTFSLGNLQVDAESDGTATLDTRSLDDGTYTLTANATVEGQPVTDAVEITVTNDLPDSGQVGPNGGTLRSGEGSYATLPPGALDDNAALTLVDTTQQQILDDFGVDYTDLGVTFLGALTVDATGTTTERSNTPVQVDLAGWAQAVQPGQDVVMFNVLPDADGDGVGELTFAANARATPDGSVVTVPTSRTEVYGVAAGNGSLRLQQIESVRPGELVELQGRGFNPQGALGNTALFGSGQAILVAPTDLETNVASPLQSVLIAVPALGAGARSVTLVNATTGFASAPFTLQIGSLGSGAQATWDDFSEQVSAAIGGLTGDNPDLRSAGEGLLSDLDSDAALRAMVANSGLVGAANRALLEAIEAGALDGAQRDLVVRHALLLDALAVSAPQVATSGADLASLLMLLASTAFTEGGDSSLRTQQAGGGCNAPSAPVFWGSPTGMGSAPPSSCAGGSGGGFGGTGGSGPIRGQRLGGSVGPVAGALVRALVPGSPEQLSPFTSVTDDAGYYQLPFLPTGEPVTIQAIDLVGGRVAEVTTVTGANFESITVPLVFVESAGPGAPTASFTATQDPNGPIGRFLFDASASSDPDGSIVEYLWVFGDGADGDDDDPLREHTYFTPGTFTVFLTVVDDEGKVGTTSVTLPELVRATEVTIATGDETGRAALPSLLVPPVLNAGGRYVVFLANGRDLSDAESFSGDRMMLYRNDMATGTVEIVSIDDDGAPATPLEYLDSGSRIGVSGDADLIAFASEEALVPSDLDSVSDIYLRDMTTGAVELALVGPNGTDPSEPAWSPSLSENGTLLTAVIGRIGTSADSSFITVTDLVTGDVTQITSGSPVRPEAPLLSDDGAFVLYLDTAGSALTRVDLDTLVSERVSETADGTPIGVSSFDITGFDVSSDGRYVAFVADGTAGCGTLSPCLLRKDMDSGEIDTLVGTANDGSFFVERAASISANGRWIAFMAEVRPDPNANSKERGFVWDEETGLYEPFDLNQVGAEPDADARPRLGMSDDGGFIAFQSDAKNYVRTLDDFPLAPLYRTDNPAWEVP